MMAAKRNSFQGRWGFGVGRWVGRRLDTVTERGCIRRRPPATVHLWQRAGMNLNFRRNFLIMMVPTEGVETAKRASRVFACVCNRLPERKLRSQRQNAPN